MALQQLPVKIAWLEIAAMREYQAPDARSSQLQRHSAADAAYPRHKHGRRLEPALRRFAEARQKHLPLVNGAFFVCEQLGVHPF